MKKPVCFLAIFCAFALSASAQKGGKDKLEVKEVVVRKKDSSSNDEKVYQIISIEKQPVFPGGEDALFNFIHQNLKYPEGKSGDTIGCVRVRARFTIEPDGTVSNIKIMGKNKAINDEVVRVIGLLPKFTPAMSSDGVPISSYITLPFNFEIK